MKAIKISLLYFVILSVTLFGCSTSVEKDSTRKVASVDLEQRPINLQAQIYRYKWPLSFPPINFYAMWKIKSKLKKYIKGLDLDKEVEKRVLHHLKRKNLRKHIIPFLLSIKGLYVPSKEVLGQGFNAHIKKVFPKGDEVAGLVHQLFHYDQTSSEGGEQKGHGGGLSIPKEAIPVLIAQVITVYDAIIIQDPNFKLGDKPVVTPELIARTERVAKEVIQKVGASLGDVTSVNKIIKFFESNPKQLKAVASTLIEVIHKYTYETYYMFALRHYREKLQKKWMLAELNKADQGELWNYIQNIGMNRRFAVHFVVDGLQGSLIKSLANGDKYFQQEILKDDKNAEKLLPPEQLQPSVGVKRQLDFLHFLEGHNYKYNHKDYLPTFKTIFSQYPEGIIKQGTTTTPTLSGRILPSIQAGAPVYGEGGTGLPNFNFVDRDSETGYYFLGNQAFLINKYIKAHGLRSLFDRLPMLNTMNCNSVYMEGQNFKIDGYLTVTIGEKMRDFGEILCTQELQKRSQNEIKLRGYYKKLLELKGEIEEDDILGGNYLKAERLIRKIAKLSEVSLPSYLLIYNPWPDHFSHYTGPYADGLISPTGELNRVDFWLGKVLDLYKNAGVYKQTLFGITGDHGLSPTYYQVDPYKLVFQKMKDEGINFKMKRLSIDPGHPSISNIYSPENLRGIDVIVGVTAGGSFVIDLFKDHGEHWKEQLKYQEIKEHRFQSGESFDFIQELLTSLGPILDYVVVRESECDLEKAKVRIIAPERGKEYGVFLHRHKNRIFYQFSGKELLGITTLSRFQKITDKEKQRHQELLTLCLNDAKLADESSWCSEKLWRELTSYTDRPAVITELSHLYDGKKAGTINIFPKLGISFSTEKIGRHGGESYHEKDPMVALWGEPVRQGMKKNVRTAPNGSVAPSIFQYLTGDPHVKKGVDGWGFDSLWRVEQGLDPNN